MDILSDVISAVRVGRPGGARVEWHAPWGVRFADEPGTAGLLVVLQGWCWLIEDSAEPVRLGPGDVVFAPRGDGYGLADSPTTPLAEAPERPAEHPRSTGGKAAREPHTVTLCGGYDLAPGWTHPLLRELPATIHMPARLGRSRGLQAAVEILGEEIDSLRPGADALKPVVIDMLILYVLRAWYEERSGGETTGGWAAALADPAIRAALNAFHDDPAHPWTVRELADRARLSRATFSRRFAALTGRPPLTYLTWWRMTVAAGLLGEPSASIAAVAPRVGYTSEFAFANAFKRHFGIAPGRFRRQPGALAHRPR